jgi:asparagine synthase (glutamine-hydrolysing)
MDHGLEVRVPLLDERLLEFALALPDHCKLGKADEYAPTGSYAATGTKSILMDIAKPLLPENFAYRSKRGFTLPFDIWLNGTLRPLMDELLSESVVAKRGFFDPAAVQEIKNSYLNKKIHYTRPWLLMMTELWAREVLDA